ncbi:MAG TPA: MFS transporter [Acidimicrobiia bacterium]|nr:MFS transporter [Acidimicrobiia bacterium]
MLYDLANTIFALGVVGLYFPAWLNEEGLADSALAVTEAVAGALVVLAAPLVGARSDQRGRRLPALGVTTAVAIASTALLARFSPLVTLVLLGIGLIGLHVGSALYDSLLADVSTAGNRGKVSGLGVGVGYVGSFIGLGIGVLSFEILDLGYSGTFTLLALGFLIFAVPVFVLVEDRRPPTPGPIPTVAKVFTGLVSSWRRAATVPGVVRFLCGRFLYTDAINTLIGGFLAIFVLRELRLTEAETTRVLGLAIFAAIAGGLLGGRLVHYWGSLATLRRVLLLWVAALILGVLAAASGLTPLIWAVGALGGAALGMTWASDRVVMLELSPPAHLGEFYGLYATVGRFATIVGPLVWALVVDVLGWGRRLALLVLAGFILAGWAVLRPLKTSARIIPSP